MHRIVISLLRHVVTGVVRQIQWIIVAKHCWIFSVSCAFF